MIKCVSGLHMLVLIVASSWGIELPLLYMYYAGIFVLQLAPRAVVFVRL